jgi:hypothetical protein
MTTYFTGNWKVRCSPAPQPGGLCRQPWSVPHLWLLSSPLGLAPILFLGLHSWSSSSVPVCSPARLFDHSPRSLSLVPAHLFSPRSRPPHPPPPPTAPPPGPHAVPQEDMRLVLLGAQAEEPPPGLLLRLLLAFPGLLHRTHIYRNPETPAEGRRAGQRARPRPGAAASPPPPSSSAPAAAPPGCGPPRPPVRPPVRPSAYPPPRANPGTGRAAAAAVNRHRGSLS